MRFAHPHALRDGALHARESALGNGGAECDSGFYNDIAYEADYNGLAYDHTEGERLARALGTKSVLMMRNHGVLVVGASCAQAFERLYFLERAAQAQVLALSTGRPLRLIPPAVVEATVAQFLSGSTVGGRERADLHFEALKRHARSHVTGLRELSSPGTAARTVGGSAGFIVVLLALVLFINYVDRGALSTALPLLQGDLNLTAAQLGLLSSAFFWTYSTIQIPVGWLAERFGAQRVLAAGLSLWGLATIGIGFVHSFAALCALRLLLGIGESAGFPCVSKLIALVVPVRGFGTANGIVACAYLFGPAAGLLAGGLLMDQYGWRSIFLTFGALSLLWLVPWSRVKLPSSALRRSDADTPNVLTLLKQPSLWGTALGLFSSNYTFYFMLVWLPFYLVRERGFTIAEMTALGTAAYTVNALSALVTGWATDKFIARGSTANVTYKTVMAVTHAGSVVCMIAMAIGSRPWALGAMFAYQVLCGAQSPGVYAIPQILAGARASGRWVGIQNSVGNFAGIIAPAATGFIIDSTRHFTGAFLLAAVMSMLGLVGWLLMLPKLAELPWETASVQGEY